MDYTIFYKVKYETLDHFILDNDNYWDIFISAYNDSERVKKVLEQVHAEKKHWLIMPEYDYDPNELPNNGQIYSYPNLKRENNFIQEYFNNIKIDLNQLQVCIDITGFMRNHLIYFIRYLVSKKIKKIDAIYSEPTTYKAKEDTAFSVEDSFIEVKQIAGCGGSYSTDTSKDILIIGSGYDHELIKYVADSKERTEKIQVFGFPSLQPDMYQENLLRASKAEDELDGTKHYKDYFAPAYDPFVTASVLQEIAADNSPYTNLYLSPLSTKAQTLGFVLYYVWECIDKPISIIFPICEKYKRETSIGISKIWKYSIELP